ncbi:hypothetical protein YC2023_042130 [Brassica napus]
MARQLRVHRRTKTRQTEHVDGKHGNRLSRPSTERCWRRLKLVEVSQNFTLEHLLSACNLIAFFSSYSVSPNSISTLLLQLHSQNSILFQNQNQNPLSSFFCVCFPSTRKIRFFLYLVDSIF